MRSVRILVVDDHPTLLRHLVRAARGADREIVAARSVEEALEHLENERFDLIITDWSINPQAHGDSDEWKLIMQAAKKKDPNAKVIVVSSFPSPIHRMRVIKDLGAYDYVDRDEPMGYMDRLRRMIPDALESHI